MGTFRLTILGCGSALPTINTHHSAHILNVCEQFYLIDCGEGTQRQLLKAGVHPLKLNCIFLTHLHGDHIFGLFPLLSTMNMMGRKTPLRIFAPRPIAELLEHFYRYYDDNVGFDILLQEIDTREHTLIYENKVLQVWSIPLRHSLSCSGFHFKEKLLPRNVRKEKIDYYRLTIQQIQALKRGEDITTDEGVVLQNAHLTLSPPKPRSYAYLSDTNPSAKAASRIVGVDLLYHEATFSSEDRAVAKTSGHSTAAQAAQVATQAQAKKLIIGHLSPRYKEPNELLTQAQAIFENTLLAQELKSYNI